MDTDPLIIRHLEFMGPMTEAGGWRPPAELPEVAFVGRSNAGKSSLLNRLVKRKAFARVSATPGRTREINFFKVNREFVLADLPGYGYARVSRQQKEAWQPLIKGYLTGSPMLRGVVMLLDSRHDPSREDLRMLDFLAELGVPTIVALTKVDKLRGEEKRTRVPRLVESLDLDAGQVIPFSARTGEGRDELAAALLTLLAQPHWRTIQ